MSKVRIISLLTLGFCILAWGCRRSQQAQSHEPAATESVRKVRPAVDRVAKAEELYQWNLETLVGDYDRAGKKSPNWDVEARQALTHFAKLRSRLDRASMESASVEVSNVLARAIGAGCDDPLILYLAARHLHPSDPDEEKQDLRNPDRPLVLAAERIHEGDYSPVRKYYSSLRAYEWCIRSSPQGLRSTEAARFRTRAINHLIDLVKDANTPGVEAAEALDQFLTSIKTPDPLGHIIVKQLEPALLENWPDEPEVYLVLGKHYRSFAWTVRSPGYPDGVSEANRKLFAEQLKIADELLTQGWELDGSDPRIPIEQINVELGQGKGRKVMESWFQRAMAADTNSYLACHAKLHYLEPKSFGSEIEMLAFGRECLASKTWGGTVPLLLTEVHKRVANWRERNEARAYWLRPEVWQDIRRCFEKYFRLHPDASRWRKDYAWFAYHCEQWEEARNQIQMMGPVNYKFFGGQDAYERMLEEIGQHTRGSNR